MERHRLFGSLRGWHDRWRPRFGVTRAWGYQRIHGELIDLGQKIAQTTVWQILQDNDIDPAPKRSEVTWTEFLRSQAAVACDFFTVDTATLRRY